MCAPRCVPARDRAFTRRACDPRRVRRLVWIVLATACTTRVPATQLDSVPQQLELDVLVTHQGVDVHTHGTDLANGCFGGSLDFPQPGHAGAWQDTVDCPTGASSKSCLQAPSLEIAGQPAPMTADPVGKDAVLVLSGCGGGARIPLAGTPPTQAMVTATEDTTARTISVSWSDDATAKTALFAIGDSLYFDLEHVVAHDFVFSLPSGVSTAAYQWIDAWALAAVVPVQTDYGVVRLWTGELTFVNLYP